MPVTTKYLGLAGNNLFQYTYARLFADYNGFEMCNPPASTIIDFVPQTDVHEGNLDETVDIHDAHQCVLGQRWPPAHYVFCGYFQRSEYYIDQVDKIRKFLVPKTNVETVNTDDIVIHVRAGDYPKLCIIHPEWYIDILDRHTFRKLYIVSGKLPEAYRRYFDKYDYEVVSGSMADDWNFLRGFDRMLISNSTFAWWSAFFSNARLVYAIDEWTANQDLYNLGMWPMFQSVPGRLGFYDITEKEEFRGND